MANKKPNVKQRWVYKLRHSNRHAKVKPIPKEVEEQLTIVHAEMGKGLKKFMVLRTVTKTKNRDAIGLRPVSLFLLLLLAMLILAYCFDVPLLELASLLRTLVRTHLF